MADQKPDDRLYDIDRMSQNSAVLDHEIQRFVVLLMSEPDEKVRATLLQAMGSLDFLQIADELRKLAVAFLRSNEAIDRLIQEIHSKLREDGKAPQASWSGEPPLTPEEVDPVFAEAMARREQDNDDDDKR